MKLKIEISPDNRMNAFGCYFSPSAKEGTAIIKLNFCASISASDTAKDFYEIISEVTAHEILHALQDIFKKQLSEKSIRKLLREEFKR
jgi:hypothetical protein